MIIYFSVDNQNNEYEIRSLKKQVESVKKKRNYTLINLLSSINSFLFCEKKKKKIQ